MHHLLLILLFTLCSCVHRLPMGSPTARADLPADFKSQISYEKIAARDLKLLNKEMAENYQIEQWEFAASSDKLAKFSQKKHKVQFEVYHPHSLSPQKTLPAMMILPISGGNYIVSRYFAKHFASRGYLTVLVHRRPLYKKVLVNPMYINQVIEQTMIDHMQVVDLIFEKYPIDKANFTLIGFSMGAIKASYLAAVDQRIQRVGFFLNAGDLPYIMSHSYEWGMMNRRSEYMEQHKLCSQEYENQLRDKLRYDPVDLIASLPEKRFMTLAYFDMCVPSSRGQCFMQKIEPADKVVLYCGHYLSLLATPYLCGKLEDFLKRTAIE